MAREGLAPMGAVPEREPARFSERVMERPYMQPEPHTKYEIAAEDIPPGMDAMWLPTKIAGAPNPQVGQYYRAGWQPARAEDFPYHSGYGVQYPEMMVEAGLLEIVKADAPVIIDDQMLVLRPRELSARANRARQQEAHNQVENQMRRLRQVSRTFRDTRIQRSHAPMPDQAPVDE